MEAAVVVTQWQPLTALAVVDMQRMPLAVGVAVADTQHQPLTVAVVVVTQAVVADTLVAAVAAVTGKSTGS